MIGFSEAQILAWVSPLLWPFLRVLALFGAMPVIAQRSVPMRLRVALAAVLRVDACEIYTDVDGVYTTDPRVVKHLEAKGPIAGMTKAASYLLSWDSFSTIRDYLTGHVVWMVSDATGVASVEFRQGNAVLKSLVTSPYSTTITVPLLATAGSTLDFTAEATNFANLTARDTKTVRPITVRTGVLPRTHGSALFTRGETQALVVATLGTERDAQRIDALAGEYEDRFMLHYNMPPFATGEVGRMGSTKRREVQVARFQDGQVPVFLISLSWATQIQVL